MHEMTFREMLEKRKRQTQGQESRNEGMRGRKGRKREEEEVEDDEEGRSPGALAVRSDDQHPQNRSISSD